MTVNGWVQIALFGAIVIAITPPVGACAGRRSPKAGAPSSPRCSGRWSAASTASPASIRRASRAGSATPSACWPPRWSASCCSTRSCGCRACLPFNPAGQTAVAPDLAFNTAVSFLTNTNWQNYGGETTMSYLSQMAGLTVQNFVSAAAGIAIAIALVRGFARRSAPDHRQFLGRPGAHHALRAAAALRGHRAGLRLAGRAADARPLCRRHHAGGGEADHRARPGRLAGGDQDAGHQRRRLLQRQLGAPVREPDGADQPDPDGRHLHPRRRPDLDVRPHGRRQAAGLGGVRRHVRAVPGRRRRRLLGRGRRQPAADRARRRSVARQHGRQGSPLRRRAARRCSPPSPPTPPAAR